MKHKLYKFLALTNTAVFVITMGACTKVESKGTLAKEPNASTTMSFSIFEDPEELLIEKSTVMVAPFIEESTKVVEPTIETTENYIENTTKENDSELKNKFGTQEELEQYLKNIYDNSGKHYIDIFNEYHEKQNEEYYAYRDDLYTAASYMLIIDKGYTLDELALELDYVLTARKYPREIIEQDYDALKRLYAISDDITGGKESNLIFQMFEQLALERHKVACVDKENHTDGKYITCENLDLEKLYNAIISERGRSLFLFNNLHIKK